MTLHVTPHSAYYALPVPAISEIKSLFRVSQVLMKINSYEIYYDIMKFLWKLSSACNKLS